MKKIILLLVLVIPLFSQIERRQFAGKDTLATTNSVDTMSRFYNSSANTLYGNPFNTSWRYTIACDSGNIEVSHSASFPATDTWQIKQGESWTEHGNLDVNFFTNLYVRRRTGSLYPIQYRYKLGGQ